MLKLMFQPEIDSSSCNVELWSFKDGEWGFEVGWDLPEERLEALKANSINDLLTTAYSLGAADGREGLRANLRALLGCR